MMKRMTRAIGYLRVSTAGQAERGMGLESQRDRVRAFAKAKGFELVDVVQEAASGGVKAGEELSYEHRPRLRSLLDRAERSEYDILIVAKFDRLSRDYATLIVLERRLQRYGVELHSAAEENGDGAVAEFMRGQLALVAQLERAMILDRVGAGKAKKKELGRHVHGRIPYGYSSSGGILSSDERATTIVRIFNDAKRGASPGAIARALEAEGLASPNGATWSAMTIRRILLNPVYCGERYGVKRAHEPIVTRRTFNIVQAELNKRSKPPRG